MTRKTPNSVHITPSINRWNIWYHFKTFLYELSVWSSGDVTTAMVMFCYDTNFEWSIAENLGQTFRRGVTQSSTNVNIHYSTVAENAVDGDYSQNMSSGHCTHTHGNRKRAWWSLELNGLATVQSINFWLRNDSKSSVSSLLVLMGLSSAKIKENMLWDICCISEKIQS